MKYHQLTLISSTTLLLNLQQTTSQSQTATLNVPGHYLLWNPTGAQIDLGLSAKGCRYEDLPTEYSINSEDEGFIDVAVNGQWNCTTRDVTREGANFNKRDICNLNCDVGYGLRTKHLRDSEGNVIPDNKYMVKSKRLICKRNSQTGNMEWQPAAKGNVFPRCHNLCGELSLSNLKNGEDDAKAQLRCRNLGAINEDTCTPGVNCHHASTCYATCENGFGLENSPSESNEIRCICTQKKCGWKIPDDIGSLGQCEFKMTSNNKRIIGGWDASYDTIATESQVSAGLINSGNRRKKRQSGESLIDHRRVKRGQQSSNLKWQHICGGVLLTAQWAFTAAHCRTVGLRCILGEINFEKRSGQEVPCRVRAQIRYPEYNGQTLHDIMMMNIQCKKLKMGEFVWPAKLPRPNTPMPVGDECTICGWGTMKYPDFAAAVNLQCVELPIIDTDTCNVPYNGAIHEKIICIGKLGVGGQDSCQGDSGGGAYCNGICYGIVMGGLYCADESYPGVYTQLSKYVGWAVKVIRAYYSQQGGGGNGRSRRRGRRSVLPDYAKNLHLIEDVSRF